MRPRQAVELHVPQPFFDVGAGHLQPRASVDHVGRQAEAVDLVLDLDLLRRVAEDAAVGHAPFITNASIRFLGRSSWRELATLDDPEALFESPEYSVWNRFRESEDTRYVGLVGPRVLLRLPYSEMPFAGAPGFHEIPS